MTLLEQLLRDKTTGPKLVALAEKFESMKQQKYKWIPFWALEREEIFTIGKTCYEKIWFVLAATCVAGHFRMILPWTRVKTTRPYGPLVLNDRSKDGIP